MKAIFERRKTKDVMTTVSLAYCLEGVSRRHIERETQAEPRNLPEERKQLRISGSQGG